MIRYFIIISLFIFGSCTNSTEQTKAERKLISTFKPQYAKGFEIQYFSDSTIKCILFNLEKKGDTLQVFEMKPRKGLRALCLSTTHIAMIDHIGALDEVKGVGFADLVQNPHARKLIDQGNIANLTTSHETDPEIIFGLRPDLFFTYPFGGEDFSRYENKGIRCIPISEYLEHHPLGRAEWVILFGAIMQREEAAQKSFELVVNNYNQLKDLAAQATQRPTAFTGSYDSGNWFAPPANSFAAQFIEDAGAEYVFTDTTTTDNLIIPIEKMIQQVYTADFWGKIVYEPGPVDNRSLVEQDARISKIKSYPNGIFYCNASESDYFGDAVMEPHIVLTDLIAIFHPELKPNHTGKYFRK